MKNQSNITSSIWNWGRRALAVALVPWMATSCGGVSAEQASAGMAANDDVDIVFEDDESWASDLDVLEQAHTRAGRPIGTFLLRPGESWDFDFLVLKSPSSGPKAFYARKTGAGGGECDGQDVCAQQEIRGTYKFWRTRETMPDGTKASRPGFLLKVDADDVGSYFYSLEGSTLTLRRTGARVTMTSAQTQAAFVHQHEAPWCAVPLDCSQQGLTCRRGFDCPSSICRSRC